MHRRTFLKALPPLFAVPHISLPSRLPTTPRRLIVDADTANEVDDLFAIARALITPELDIVGLTSAQWHTSPQAPNDTVGLSQQMNEDIVRLMGKTGVPAIEGSNIPLVTPQRPQPSEAADFIIEHVRATPAGEKLDIAILGPCTNIASAVLLAPDIIPKISVHYIGFWHSPATGTWSKREFNTNNDPNAVDILLNTRGLDVHIMTASTSQHLVFTKTEADHHLKNKGGIGDYLINRWESYERWWQADDKEKERWIMWDVAIIEALADPTLGVQESFMTPHDNMQRTIQAYVSIDVGAMKARFWNAFDAFLD